MINDIPDQKRLKLLAKLASGEILDVGCHDVQNPYLNGVVGFDIEKPLSVKPNYKQFIEGDCQEIDKFFVPLSFDSIIAGELIEHLENPSNFLRGCHSILKSSGKLFLPPILTIGLRL